MKIIKKKEEITNINMLNVGDTFEDEGEYYMVINYITDNEVGFSFNSVNLVTGEFGYYTSDMGIRKVNFTAKEE